MKNKSNVDVKKFRSRENWYGSFYELAFYFNDALKEPSKRLQLLQCVWNGKYLEGVVSSLEDLGDTNQEITFVKLDDHSRYYGLIKVEDTLLACMTSFFSSEGLTIFTLNIPLEIISKKYNVKYPVTAKQNPWMKYIDSIFILISLEVYQRERFDIAVIGEEASAVTYKKYINNLKDENNLVVPSSLFSKLNMAKRGTEICEGLMWIE
ncbi:hypothetical protein KDW_41540 [Dictyobacter vulcani]|uniref:Uncharacterized protein n=1 Tax=Dictyobacter vulcani TaxID=2607529 RepID=A0A5J4KSA4_9CHLR|nr:hypothetical protein [Dictyobacter vulcani]GER89992.1 hypothetical protein KDW_41540 [Dictyobacter vulcani]